MGYLDEDITDFSKEEIEISERIIDELIDPMTEYILDEKLRYSLKVSIITIIRNS